MAYIDQIDLGGNIGNSLLVRDTAYNGTRISTSATTLVSAAARRLVAVSINKRPPGPLTIYDTATATGTLGSSAIKMILDSSNVAGTRLYNVAFNKGIVVVCTVTGGDFTIIWR